MNFSSKGVRVFIYSPLGITTALDQTNINMRLRLILKVRGGRICLVALDWWRWPGCHPTCQGRLPLASY